MKKNFILLICLFVTLGVAAQEQKKWSRWSIAIEGGANRFDGDVRQRDYSFDVVPRGKTNLSFGGTLEYNLTPVWNLGIDYYNLPLSGVGEYYSFETAMQNASFFFSFNLTKGLFPRTPSKWGLFANIGLGYSWHVINYQTTTDDDWQTGVKNVTSNGQPRVKGAAGVFYEDWDVVNKKGNAMVIPMALALEYNISKSVALGLKAQLRAYNKDDIDGRMRPNANDVLEAATLGLRFKLGANNKDHLRNISMAQYSGSDVTRDDIDRLQRKIDAIVIPGPDPRIDELDNRLRKVENYLDIDGPDDDNDGVANSRDKEPDTPEGTQVDFWGRGITNATTAAATYDPSAFIFFDFDKTNLDEEAHVAIRLAADKLKADPTLLVEVRGFTDNMGTDAYNANLSQRRADKVKNELVTRYGIEADRIVANGKGKYNPQDRVMPFRPYRTAAFFYSK